MGSSFRSTHRADGLQGQSRLGVYTRIMVPALQVWGGGEDAYHKLYRYGGIAMLGWTVLWNSVSLLERKCNPDPAAADSESAVDQNPLISP